MYRYAVAGTTDRRILSTRGFIASRQSVAAERVAVNGR
jgi:hypothetical protein